MLESRRFSGALTSGMQILSNGRRRSLGKGKCSGTPKLGKPNSFPRWQHRSAARVMRPVAMRIKELHDDYDAACAESARLIQTVLPPSRFPGLSVDPMPAPFYVADDQRELMLSRKIWHADVIETIKSEDAIPLNIFIGRANVHRLALVVQKYANDIFPIYWKNFSVKLAVSRSLDLIEHKKWATDDRVWFEPDGSDQHLSAVRTCAGCGPPKPSSESNEGLISICAACVQHYAGDDGYDTVRAFLHRV
jgi:hypothetical protein